ncbi:prenylcysteine oxidase 1 [Temnothorax nylanderi]|uniref:prenylcysteine oxidase 1 n=1 Tax=Temnothorax nylanderi TaxID=102681 RepID=UPI003A8AFCA4
MKHRVQTMRQYTALLVLGVLILQGFSLELSEPRIAIIGGGIGGASASHFLTELFSGALDVDLYEAKTIGGRLATVEIDGDEVEAGGTIIHPKNMCMQKFVKLLGLEKKSPSKEKMGIWNGDEFVFIESDWSMISMWKLFYRYGYQPFTLQRHINSMIEDFTKIYDLQDAGHSFTNIEALLSAMNKDFPKLLHMSTKEYFLRMDYSEKLINELVESATVVNYGQDVTDIQSFVGSISVAASGDLWSVKGGNKKVPEQLIYRNEKVKVIPSRVTKIRNLLNHDDSHRYEVTYVNKDNATMTSTYDIVIIAAPLTRDQEFQIEFVDLPDLVFPGKYQTTYATFVKGDLAPKYFDLQEAVDSILCCNPNKTKISSIGKVDSVDGSIEKNSSVWKIFSRTPVETRLLDVMFSHVTENKQIGWKAYPHYSTNMKLGNFKLHDALYHVNAIEWAASAMEMSAIAGRNVAILANKDFLQKSSSSKMSNEEVLKSSPKKRTAGEL